MQRFFSNPSLCYEQREWLLLQRVRESLKKKKRRRPTAKVQFRPPLTNTDTISPGQDVRSTFDIFAMHKLDGPSSSAETGSLAAAGQQTDADAVYFAKYLTSPKLFDLQLSDIQFRRKVRAARRMLNKRVTLRNVGLTFLPSTTIARSSCNFSSSRDT
jgi:hypothetical protein